MLSSRIRALRGAPALVNRPGEAEPSRKREFRHMLGAQDAADAVRLQYELDVCGHRFGS